MIVSCLSTTSLSSNTALSWLLRTHKVVIITIIIVVIIINYAICPVVSGAYRKDISKCL